MAFPGITLAITPRCISNLQYIDKKENKIFLIYCKGNSDGSAAKSYMRKGFLIYEEMRQYFRIYEEVVSHMTLHPIPLNFLIYEENFLFFFISAHDPPRTVLA
jgi:hypothetical protein